MVGLRIRLRLGLRVRGDDRINVVVRDDQDDDDAVPVGLGVSVFWVADVVVVCLAVMSVVQVAVPPVVKV